MHLFKKKTTWLLSEHKQNMLFLFLTLFSVAFLLIVCGRVYNPANRIFDFDDVSALSENWTVTDTNGITFSVQLPAQLGVSSDGPRSISHKLTGDVPKDPGICFRSSQQNVRVLLNSACVYTYNTDSTRPYGDATPSTWCFARLPSAKAGDTITIELTTPYADYAGTFNDVYYSSYYKLKMYIMLKCMPGFIICIGIFMLGCVLYVMFIFLAPHNALYGNMRYIGLFTACVSLYLLMETQFPDVGVFNPFTELLIKFLALSTVTLPFLLYVKLRLSEENSLPLDILFWLFLINHFTQIALQLLGVLNTMQMVVNPLRVTHTLISVAGLTVIYMYAVAIIKKRIKLYMTEILAFIAVIVAVTAEFVSYYGGHFGDIGRSLQIGIIFFSISISIAAMQNAADRTAESIRVESLLQQSQTQLMISQIQPHFIYNTLHAIRALIRIAPDQASQMTLNFSKYLRANIDALGLNDNIPFQREIEHVRAYTDIELVRFSDRLTVEWQLDAVDFLVPPLTIQPLVENAIKHGVCKKEEGGTVKISSREEEEAFVITIEDNGVGMDAAQEKKVGSAGLQNVRLRLEHMCHATFTLHSEIGVGTTAKISIPKGN
ncbi:MAG: histidine kinase [Eubacteriales bacterium]|nr:histidine kinase [Eubacteriales bacterium]